MRYLNTIIFILTIIVANNAFVINPLNKAMDSRTATILDYFQDACRNRSRNQQELERIVDDYIYYIANDYSIDGFKELLISTFITTAYSSKFWDEELNSFHLNCKPLKELD